MTYNLNPTKELTNWQKKIITKRTKKNFFKELDKMSPDKKRYIKVFNKQLEVLVKNFDNQGLMFYSLDIEYFVEKKQFITFDLVSQEVITKYYFDCFSQISALSFFCKIESEKVITLLEK